jgi:hypothetical protein
VRHAFCVASAARSFDKKSSKDFQIRFRFLAPLKNLGCSNTLFVQAPFNAYNQASYAYFMQGRLLRNTNIELLSYKCCHRRGGESS